MLAEKAKEYLVRKPQTLIAFFLTDSKFYYWKSTAQSESIDSSIRELLSPVEA